MNKIQLSLAEQQEVLLRLKRNYIYDAEHGRLVNARTGKVPKGALNSSGYNRLDLRMGDKKVKISMHRSVFAHCYGRWPEKQIDHLNGCRTDNRIENLREVSQSENKMNQVHPWKPQKDTGLPGVDHHKHSYRIKVHQRLYNFHDPYEAFFHLTLLGRQFEAATAAAKE